MMAHFRIECVRAIAGFPDRYRWPQHEVWLATGNSVILNWNETESADCRDQYGQWKPRPPGVGDTLIIDEDGNRLAVITATLWRWKQREDCRKGIE